MKQNISRPSYIIGFTQLQKTTAMMNCRGGLVILLLLVGFGSCQIGTFEGFGTDMNLQIYSEVVISSQQEFISALQSHLIIRFRPGLVLNLTSNLMISNLTDVVIMGPVTFNSFGLYINHSHNIIAKNLRILNSSIYGILIYHSTYVVVDHCTIIDSGRTSIDKGKCIDLTEQSKIVTISWNILAYTYPIEELLKYKGLLAANFLEGPVENVSIHKNLFYCVYQRSPEISSPGLFDLRQNVIFNYTVYGSRIRNEAIGNFIRNRYIGGKKDPLVFEVPETSVFCEGNTWKYDCKENRQIQDIKIRGEFKVPEVSSQSVQSVVKKAGCETRGLLELKMSAQVLSYL